jgi:ABC-type uncharacterized transport system permease subunit
MRMLNAKDVRKIAKTAKRGINVRNAKKSILRQNLEIARSARSIVLSVMSKEDVKNVLKNGKLVRMAHAKEPEYLTTLWIFFSLIIIILLIVLVVLYRLNKSGAFDFLYRNLNEENDETSMMRNSRLTG